MSPAAIADVRHTVETLERRFAGLEGRVDATIGRLAGIEERVGKLSALTQDVLEFSSAQVSELRKLFDTTEEHLRSIRGTLDVTAEQQGRMLRQLAELQR